MLMMVKFPFEMNMKFQIIPSCYNRNLPFLYTCDVITFYQELELKTAKVIQRDYYLFGVGSLSNLKVNNLNRQYSCILFLCLFLAKVL